MEIKIENYPEIKIGNNLPITLIAGPCVIENKDKALYAAESIKNITEKLNIGFIYKSSYDKANRTSASSFRGVGIEEGLKILESVKRTLDLPLVSDIHKETEINQAKDVIDIIQIPAFLCRQTDLLVAAGNTGKIVNIKKGQFVSAYDMKPATDKIFQTTGNNKIMLTERGTFFGYNNLVVDMRSLPILASFNYPVIFDAGHSVQAPGAKDGKSGGDRSMIPYLAQAAIATKIAGIFLETHPDPDNAPCDGPNMLPISELESFLRKIIKIDQLVKSW